MLTKSSSSSSSSTTEFCNDKKQKYKLDNLSLGNIVASGKWYRITDDVEMKLSKTLCLGTSDSLQEKILVFSLLEIALESNLKLPIEDFDNLFLFSDNLNR